MSLYIFYPCYFCSLQRRLPDHRPQISYLVATFPRWENFRISWAPSSSTPPWTKVIREVQKDCANKLIILAKGCHFYLLFILQAHIQGNLARLSEVTEWSAMLEDKLLQTEVFTKRTFIDQIKVGLSQLKESLPWHEKEIGFKISWVCNEGQNWSTLKNQPLIL